MASAGEMIAAVRAGETGRVGELLHEDPELLHARSETGESAVLLSVYHGHATVTALLLSQAPRLTLFEAAAVGDLARVRECQEEDPAAIHAFSEDGFTALHLAAFFGQAEVVEELIRRGAIVSTAARNETFARGSTPLHSAAARGEMGIAGLLLEGGADANARDGGGWRPLHIAAGNGQAELVEMLLEAGADAEAQNDDGTTALALARERGNERVAELLR